MTETHLAFSIRRSALRDRVLIPKYYDPDLAVAADLASERFELRALRDLLLPGQRGSRLGDWIRRELYGTGGVPYVRTSDLSSWRIRPDFKKGVSEAVYESIRERQDVAPGDMLFVAHGTYLVGTVAIVTEEEPKLVLQDHIFRLRVDPASGVDARYLLAALSTNFVRRQVRARQFSADIIDKVGERHLSIAVPVSRDPEERQRISTEVESILRRQTEARRRGMHVTGSDLRMTRERAEARFGFGVKRTAVRRRILLPKYYDPALEAALVEAEQADHEKWVSLGELVASGDLRAEAGVEVGKMAYGTGDIPFVRTSDIAEWEIRRDIRHGVSNRIYEANARKAGVQENDLLVVRDGTYLVGSSAIASSDDLPALCCGGIIRLRLTPKSGLDPHVLLGVLNLPIVRRQMRARQFTRDVIDTLGQRLLEVRVPSLRSQRAEVMGREISEIVQIRNEAKRRIDGLIRSIEPPAPPIITGRPSWSMR